MYLQYGILYLILTRPKFAVYVYIVKNKSKFYTGEETELAVTVIYYSERKFSTKGVIIIQLDFCYQEIYSPVVSSGKKCTYSDQTHCCACAVRPSFSLKVQYCPAI
jgi:hypothetical protein